MRINRVWLTVAVHTHVPKFAVNFRVVYSDCLLFLMMFAVIHLNRQ